MTLDELSILLDELAVPHDNLKLGGKNNNRVSVCCPFAPWTHDSGKDTRPSMGIWLDEDGPAKFKCWTCHESGTVWQMIRDVGLKLDDDRLQALALQVLRDDRPTMVKILTGVESRLRGWGGEAHHPLPPLSLSALDRFLPAWESAESISYLKDRKVPKYLAIEFGLRHDPFNGRILFPVENRKGNLKGAVGRALDDETQPKYYNYFGIQTEIEVGGAPQIARGRRTLVVEGYFDFLRIIPWVRELDANVVCSFKADLSGNQINLLLGLDCHLEFWYDYDGPGVSGATKGCDAVSRKGGLAKKIKLPDDVDPGKMSKDVFLEVFHNSQIF